jgi:hypothetical protein
LRALLSVSEADKALRIRVAAMPLYSFHISNGAFSDAADGGFGFELADGTAAWAEMTGVCADLLGSVSLGLKQDSEWSLELRDETKKPLFRMRLVAESLEKAS